MIIFVIYVCTDMEFPKNDDDSEDNYIDESNAEYKLLQRIFLEALCRENLHFPHSPIG